MAGVDETVGPTGIETLTGTLEQVQVGLSRLNAHRVIAVTLEYGSVAKADALAQTIERIAPLIGGIIERRQAATLNSIVETLVPDVAPPHHMLVEAGMAANARKAVLEGGDWLTAAEVAEVAGFSGTNPSAQPNRWKKEGQIFAVRHRGVDYFPGYALDPASGYRPVKALGKVLAAFGRKKDAWGLAYWFASVNSYLGGKRPQDLLADQPDRVLAAAADEIAGVLHA